jgi:diketogulonate reductase-like aldo/keto reductase
MNSRDSLFLLASLGLSFSDLNFIAPMLKRKTPSTQEELPCIGLGTWQTFDVGISSTELSPLKDVLKRFVELQGSVIDSSPMYGNAERVAGDLCSELGLSSEVFVATKVWTSGEAEGINQMNTSFRLLKRNVVDLMQIHNLVDWQTHLKTLRKWKEEGKIRYIGLTHYTDSAHDTLRSIIKDNMVDFIQINYNLLDRKAEGKLLPLAQEKGIATLINRPFEEGALFDRVKGKSLPEWANEFDCTSWAQFFLKFILSSAAVTCVIPATSNIKHLADNMNAGFGRLPDPNHKKKMIELFR